MYLDPALRTLAKKAALPPDGWATVGTAVSVLSFIYFVHNGFNIGIGPTLSILIGYYDQIVSFFLGSLKPYIEIALRSLGWPITLHPHWKHIFVLLALYFLSGFKVELAEYRAGRTSSPIFRLLLGLSITSITSVTVGAIPLTRTGHPTNFLAAAIPLFLVSVNDFLLRAWRGLFARQYETQRVGSSAQTWWEYVRPAARGIGIRMLIGLVVIFGLLFLFAGQIASPGLACLAVIVIYLAIYQLYLGVVELSSLRQANETTAAASLRSRGLMIGFTIFRVVLWSALLMSVEKGKDLLLQ
ncbi:MAG: hypothetical protein QOF19_1723 [Alphaproteobacteria bacterium]|jgi:hypothetical protein|nr:hypothetical protein [Alphaproteobacteria bacterium]